MSNKVRLVLAGAAGRMGRALLQAADTDQNCQVVAAFEHPQSDAVGTDSGVLAGIAANQLLIADDITQVLEHGNTLVDFTVPVATLANLRAACAQGKKAVVGTTGFSPQEREELRELGEKMALVVASNMSVGVTLCLDLVRQAASVLGDEVDIEIIEAHHRHKVDAPSGTALSLGEEIAAALGRDLADCAVFGREGHTGPRDRKTIGFETIRAGDIVGEHTVMFAAEGERIEIVHRASSRQNFARGALRAADWLSDKDTGLYDMRDVLGLRA